MKARMSFVSLNLNSSIIQALTAAGYTEATPVQAKSVPEALAGHDLMCSAPTGTGAHSVDWPSSASSKVLSRPATMLQAVAVRW